MNADRTEIIDSSSLHLTVIESVEDFDNIRPAWNDLCGKSTEYCPMLGHNWLSAWWDAFGEERQLYVVLVWQGEQLVGAAPLAYETRKIHWQRRRVITGFSNAWVDRYHFLAVEPQKPIIDLVLEHLVNTAPHWDRIEFEPFDDSTSQMRLLVEALNEKGMRSGMLASLQSPRLILGDSWEGMLQALSSSFRQTVKRKIRKAEKTASIEMRIATDASCIDDIMTISLESWQHENGTSMASTSQIRNFYTRVIQGAATDGSLQVGLMYINGEPAAFDFNLIGRSILHNFKLGFRRQYAQLSPGIVLKSYVLQEIFEHQSDRPIAELDFMGTSEPYKLSWTDSVRSHSRLLIFSDRIDMRFAHWLTFRLKPFVRKTMPWLISLLRKVKNFKNR